MARSLPRFGLVATVGFEPTWPGRVAGLLTRGCARRCSASIVSGSIRDAKGWHGRVVDSGTRIYRVPLAFKMISPVHVLPRWFSIVFAATVPIFVSLILSIEFSISYPFQFVIVAIAILFMVRVTIDLYFLNEKDQKDQDKMISERFDKIDEKFDESVRELKADINQTFGATVAIMHNLHGKQQPSASLKGGIKGGAGQFGGDLKVRAENKSPEMTQSARKWYRRIYTNVEGMLMRFLGWA